jgi:hypothetical protein
MIVLVLLILFVQLIELALLILVVSLVESRKRSRHAEGRGKKAGRERQDGYGKA